MPRKCDELCDEVLVEEGFLFHKKPTRAKLAPAFYDGGNLLDPGHRIGRGSLNAFYSGLDFVGRPGCLPGQFLDFVGYHGKPFAGLSGPGGFDGGVEEFLASVRPNQDNL